MAKVVGVILVGALLMAGIPCWADSAVESEGQLRLTYYALNRLRSVSRPGASFRDYREAVARARQYVGLLRGDGAGVQELRAVMTSYERALTLWALREESESAVDSLRSDRPEGEALLRECPDIPRFHRKGRDQIYVLDGVACIWAKAAEQLDRVPAALR